jgi:imidazolonepropionase-like amidohydrolase
MKLNNKKIKFLKNMKFNSQILSTIALILFFCSAVLAQNPTPGNKQTKSILINGATIHDGVNGVYHDASLGFANGKIVYLSYLKNDNDEKILWDTIIDAKGKHVYPGIIALNTNLGLSEIEAIRAMNDYAEVGNNNPSARALIAYNTDSKVTPTVRSNGILMAQITPQGGVISGSSSVVNLDAWNWEDAAYKADEGIHINWPSMRVYHGNGSDQDDFEKKQKERIAKEIEFIESLFADAYAYQLNANPVSKNLNLEAMRGLFNGTKKLYIHADYVKEIIAAINLCNQYKLSFTLVGAADAALVLNLIKENNVNVILGRTHTLPSRDDDDIEAPYVLPKKLFDAGIVFALSCEGFWQVRNLPFIAGTAAAYGLSKEQALSSITYQPAKILGIDKTVGSIQKGKDATLLICDGDLLDMKSSNIKLAFIQGRKINLDNIQHQLYQKYKSKYGLK